MKTAVFKQKHFLKELCTYKQLLTSFSSVYNYKMSSTLIFTLGFPGDSDGKELACSVGDLCLIHGSGRAPGEENGDTLQYSCLENSMDAGAWWATVNEVAKSWAQFSD